MSRRSVRGVRAVVTGGGSGLGRALALEIARRDGRVVVADVNLAAAEETVEAIARETGDPERAVAFGCDVRNVDALERAADTAERSFGGVELIANNAGVAVGGDTGEVPLEDWQFALDVNLRGVIHGCHVFVPRFRRQGGGFVLNVASAAGLISAPRLGPYNVTKAGVVALSETLHAELRDQNVHVTVLCPTFFRTNILEAARGAEDETRNVVRDLMERSRVQASDVARAALDAVERNRLYCLPMRDGRIAWRLKRLLPATFAKLMSRARRRFDPAVGRS